MTPRAAPAFTVRDRTMTADSSSSSSSTASCFVVNKHGNKNKSETPELLVDGGPSRRDDDETNVRKGGDGNGCPPHRSSDVNEQQNGNHDQEDEEESNESLQQQLDRLKHERDVAQHETSEVLELLDQLSEGVRIVSRLMRMSFHPPLPSEHETLEEEKEGDHDDGHELTREDGGSEPQEGGQCRDNDDIDRGRSNHSYDDDKHQCLVEGRNDDDITNDAFVNRSRTYTNQSSTSLNSIQSSAISIQSYTSPCPDRKRLSDLLTDPTKTSALSRGDTYVGSDLLALYASAEMILERYRHLSDEASHLLEDRDTMETRLNKAEWAVKRLYVENARLNKELNAMRKEKSILVREIKRQRQKRRTKATTGSFVSLLRGLVESHVVSALGEHERCLAEATSSSLEEKEEEPDDYIRGGGASSSSSLSRSISQQEDVDDKEMDKGERSPPSATTTKVQEEGAVDDQTQRERKIGGDGATALDDGDEEEAAGFTLAAALIPVSIASEVAAQDYDGGSVSADGTLQAHQGGKEASKENEKKVEEHCSPPASGAQKAARVVRRSGNSDDVAGAAFSASSEDDVAQDGGDAVSGTGSVQAHRGKEDAKEDEDRNTVTSASSSSEEAGAIQKNGNGDVVDETPLPSAASEDDLVNIPSRRVSNDDGDVAVASSSSFDGRSASAKAGAAPPVAGLGGKLGGVFAPKVGSRPSSFLSWGGFDCSFRNEGTSTSSSSTTTTGNDYEKKELSPPEPKASGSVCDRDSSSVGAKRKKTNDDVTPAAASAAVIAAGTKQKVEDDASSNAAATTTTSKPTAASHFGKLMMKPAFMMNNPKSPTKRSSFSFAFPSSNKDKQQTAPVADTSNGPPEEAESDANHKKLPTAEQRPKRPTTQEGIHVPTSSLDEKDEYTPVHFILGSNDSSSSSSTRTPPPPRPRSRTASASFLAWYDDDDEPRTDATTSKSSQLLDGILVAGGRSTDGIKRKKGRSLCLLDIGDGDDDDAGSEDVVAATTTVSTPLRNDTTRSAPLSDPSAHTSPSSILVQSSLKGATTKAKPNQTGIFGLSSPRQLDAEEDETRWCYDDSRTDLLRQSDPVGYDVRDVLQSSPAGTAAAASEEDDEVNPVDAERYLRSLAVPRTLYPHPAAPQLRLPIRGCVPSNSGGHANDDDESRPPESALSVP